MKHLLIISSLVFTFGIFSCTKDKTPVPPVYLPEQWEKFIGDYKVYDTVGNYLYDFNIKHTFKGLNIYGIERDSLVIENFNQKLDLRFEFQEMLEANFLEIGVHHPVYDSQGKRWHISKNYDSNNIHYNFLINDTLILYFTMSNIAFYIPDAVPYYDCECKQVAVKQ
jgi:hypothetical protein